MVTVIWLSDQAMVGKRYIFVLSTPKCLGSLDTLYPVTKIAQNLNFKRKYCEGGFSSMTFFLFKTAIFLIVEANISNCCSWKRIALVMNLKYVFSEQ